jgi:4-diphosphocytidyl-2-C-methyl-D-erythritol kinase
VSWSEAAPAKINLFLHVGPVQADGYHPLASLVVFADVGDALSAEPSDALSLAIEGPFAAGLADDADNLVLTALRALGRAVGAGDPPLRLTLDKRLPIAAGLGGGSADAGAALRLARRVLDLPIDAAGLERVAAGIGADGSMCLRARAAWASGRGDALEDAVGLPALHAVLVNPGVPSPTGAVYRAYDAAPRPEADMPPRRAFADAGDLTDWLAGRRNDLEAPAIALAPAIGEAVAAVAAQPDVGLARMSGSGATVFGLVPDAAAARSTAAALAARRPDWWVRACRLG